MKSSKKLLNSNKRGKESMAQVLTRLVREEGWRGLYRGYTAGLVGTVHGGVQFYFLELLKYYPKSTQLIYGLLFILVNSY